MGVRAHLRPTPAAGTDTTSAGWSLNERERRERARLRALVLAHVPHETLVPEPIHGATVVEVARACGVKSARMTGILTACVRDGLLRRDVVQITGYGPSPRYRIPAPPQPPPQPPPPAVLQEPGDPVALYRFERGRRSSRLRAASSATIAECRALLEAETARARENKGARRGRPRGSKNRT